MYSLIKSICLLVTIILHNALAQSTSSRPAPGTTISLLFLNQTAVPLTAYIQRWEPSGQTTYLINCAASDATTCGIGDATISVVTGKTYDYHTGQNGAGALTIHCTFEADGKTPASCTRTVAGGPDGYEINTSVPSQGQWAYLPVKITKNPVKDAYQTAAAVPSATTSPTAASSGVLVSEGTTTVPSAAAATGSAVVDSMTGNGVGRVTAGGAALLAALTVVQVAFAML